ncbi:MAG: hypothetical protein QOF70_7051, partial [Acetobacteraceae bacterium]|nr:hypothetical protein [Acetobacteraceae bacterium]
DHQVQVGGRSNAAHQADRRCRDQGARHGVDEQQRDKLWDRDQLRCWPGPDAGDTA